LGLHLSRSTTETHARALHAPPPKRPHSCAPHASAKLFHTLRSGATRQDACNDGSSDSARLEIDLVPVRDAHAPAPERCRSATVAAADEGPVANTARVRA